MRKQYYFRTSPRGLLAWDVDRLVRLADALPPIEVPLTQILELDESWAGDHEPATWRTMVDHIRLIEEADLSFPIILSATGAVMDGMHRAAKALLEGRASIQARQFVQDPEPDYVGLGPDHLSY